MWITSFGRGLGWCGSGSCIFSRAGEDRPSRQKAKASSSLPIIAGSRLTQAPKYSMPFLPPTSSTLARILAADVAFKLVNSLALRRDDPVHQITDRNDAHDRFAFENGQMADSVHGHDAHAFFHRVRRRGRNHWRGKDFTDFSFPGRFASERYFAGVIALGHHAQRLALRLDEQGPDVFFRHQFERFEDSRLRRNGPDSGAFVLQYFVHCSRDSHTVSGGYGILLPAEVAWKLFLDIA